MVGVFIARETPTSTTSARSRSCVFCPSSWRKAKETASISRAFASVRSWNKPGFSCGATFRWTVEPFEDRAHDVERIDAVRAAFGSHHPAKVVGNQRVDDDRRALAGFVNDLVDLPRLLHVGPANQADRGVLELHQRRPHHSLGGVAGGVGNDKDREHGADSSWRKRHWRQATIWSCHGMGIFGTSHALYLPCVPLFSRIPAWPDEPE